MKLCQKKKTFEYSESLCLIREYRNQILNYNMLYIIKAVNIATQVNVLNYKYSVDT